MSVTIHNKYMSRCLELALKGLGKTKSNPLVGAVIVYKDLIIGEGYHRELGGSHAEVNAINSVTDHSLLKKATLYVNLEPCCHFGKTPPCTQLIKQSGIPLVVIGTRDPNPQVAGKGINFLKQNGIQVITKILEEECRFLNRRFFTFQEKDRPYIILKWAQSADGFMDTRIFPGKNKKRSVITGKRSQILVHKWRSEEMGIMIGTITAIMDDPYLNVRYWKGDDPLRISVERNKTITKDLHLIRDKIKTIIYTEIPKDNSTYVEYICPENKPLSLQFIMKDLREREVLSLIIEGGATLLNSFLEDNIWDEARIFTGNDLLYHGLRAPVINIPGRKYQVQEDTLNVIFNNFQ